MTSDLVAAVDETAANVLLHAAEAALGTRSTSGSSSLGPFDVSYSAAVSFSGGTVRLVAPGTVAIDDLRIDYSLSLTLSIDLSFLDFCLPRICIPTPFGDICTPKICITFPTISVPVSFSDQAKVSGDFRLDVTLSSGEWVVDVVIQQVRAIDLGTAATLLLTAIGTAISVALLAVPFIGPLLALAVGIITAAFGIAEVTGLLAAVVNVFLAGLRFEVYRHAQTFAALPAAGPFDPAVDVTLASVTAEVRASDENELVLSADI
jgi:hypothetical protein